MYPPSTVTSISMIQHFWVKKKQNKKTGGKTTTASLTTTLQFFLFHPEGKSKKEKGAPIQRSTETGMAVELTRNMSRQPSRESNNGSMNSYNSEGKSVNHTLPVLLTFHQPLLHSPHPPPFVSLCLLYIATSVFRLQCLYIFLIQPFQMGNFTLLKLL